jgi:beta-glucosidase
VISAVVKVCAGPYYPPLKVDNSLQQLINNPPAFERVVSLLAARSNMSEARVKEKLIVVAPDLFCGLFIALTEFLAIDITRQELEVALREPDADSLARS